MRKSILVLAAVALAAGFSSCGVSGAYIFNHNANSTQVHLSEANFRVVDKVTGTADVSSVLIFGGVNKRQLYQNAYADMIDAANLLEGSRALTNIVTEEHVGGVPPFYYKRTITVSANVIEFNE